MLQSSHSRNAAHIALYQPDIPGNTGSILRLAACLDCVVHVIEPAGFRLDNRSLQRAGLDYIEARRLVRHEDFAAFDAFRRENHQRLIVCSTMADARYTDFTYRADDCLLFGRETAGLPEPIHALADERITIPMLPGARSLNLAMSVGMIVGEMRRHCPLG